MLTINGKQLQYHNAFEINLQKNPMIIQGIYDIQHTIPRLIFITDELTHPLIEIHITPKKEVPTFEQAK
jgi:hypothetical protein